MHRHVRPIICPPKCVFHDSYIKREVPVIHPIVNVNRQHIVNVPRHIYQPMTRNVVVDPGYMDPSQCHMNPAQNYMNPAQNNMSPAQNNMSPAQNYMNPAQNNMNPAHGCNRCK